MMEAPGPLDGALERGLQSLADGSGRTVVLAGPPGSGKSARLAKLRERLKEQGVRVSDLKGAHRDLEAPYALVQPLEDPDATTVRPDEDEVEIDPSVPIAAAVAGGDEPSRRSRRGRGERQRGSIMGVAYAVRGRGVSELDPSAFWGNLCRDVREDPGLRRAVLVDDATFADNESREYLLYLVERARLRPLLLVLALDSTAPSLGAWEERLRGRGDVDWVHAAPVARDPRELDRLKESLDKLPSKSVRVLGLIALLGGTTTEVILSRVSRLLFRELADTLYPLVGAHIVRVENGKLSLTHAEWAAMIPELLAPGRPREMHREIAEGLEAMHPEPTLAHRVELADHYFSWEPGATALRYLLEAAELSERLSAHDEAADLLRKALLCVDGLPTGERPLASVELRLLRARTLFFAGRGAEAERELEEGLTLAAERAVALEPVEDALEALAPILFHLGARDSTSATLERAAGRLEAAGRISDAVTLIACHAIALGERGIGEHSRAEARRAGSLARRLERGPVQALALLAVAISRRDGNAEERTLAERFRESSREMLRERRRVALEQFAEELRARRLAHEGAAEEALGVHLQSIAALRRLQAQPIELLHQLDVAELLLDSRPDERAAAALHRSREIVDSLHLTPPCPSLWRFWMLQGRQMAHLGDRSAARDRLAAVADAPSEQVPSATMVRARLALARLEADDGREEVGRRHFDALPASAFPGSLRPTWESFVANPAPATASAEASTGRSPGKGPGRARKRS